MFQKLTDRLRDFMAGRYGQDQLGICLFVAGLVMMVPGMILGRFFPWAVAFNILSWILLLWCIYRIYSRNIAARAKENRAFVGFFSRLKDRKHRYYRCPSCRQRVRVPRGRGKISIRCPKCTNKFIKKT